MKSVCAFLMVAALAFPISGCSSDTIETVVPSSTSVPVPSQGSTSNGGARMLATQDPSARTDLISWSQARERAAFLFRVPGDERAQGIAQLDGVLAFDTPAGEGFTAYYGDDLIFTVEPQTGDPSVDGILTETYRPDLAKDDRLPAYVAVQVGQWHGYGHDLRTQTMRDGSLRSTGSMLSWTEPARGGYVNYWMFSEHLSLDQLQGIAEHLEQSP